LFYNERHKTDADASPRSILYTVADTGREITRAPARLTRMSDEEEIRIGNELAQRYSVGLSTNDVAGRKLHPGRRPKKSFLWRTASCRTNSIIFPDPNMVNAFALPGGHVFVGGGLLRFMDTERSTGRGGSATRSSTSTSTHCAERGADGSQCAQVAPDRCGSARKYSDKSVSNGLQQKNRSWLRIRTETRLAVVAGYSPIGAIRLFERFQRMEDEHTRHHLTIPPKR